jgi:hypothetical protein
MEERSRCLPGTWHALCNTPPRLHLHHRVAKDKIGVSLLVHCHCVLLVYCSPRRYMRKVRRGMLRAQGREHELEQVCTCARMRRAWEVLSIVLLVWSATKQ